MTDRLPHCASGCLSDWTHTHANRHSQSVWLPPTTHHGGLMRDRSPPSQTESGLGYTFRRESWGGRRLEPVQFKDIAGERARRLQGGSVILIETEGGKKLVPCGLHLTVIPVLAWCSCPCSSSPKPNQEVSEMTTAASVFQTWPPGFISTAENIHLFLLCVAYEVINGM